MAQSRAWTALPSWAIYPVGLIPAIDLFARAFADMLGADPLRVLENGLGEWALRYLLLGLSITPLMRFARINLVKYRRAIGLTAFIYVVLHFSVYLALDQQFNWPAVAGDIAKRPYIAIGMAAFAMLVPLAVTSNGFSIRKLGAKAWRGLHRLVYPAVLFASVHYILLVKSWPPEPMVYLGLAIGLLAARMVKPARQVRMAG